jgi:hypothetical protein
LTIVNSRFLHIDEVDSEDDDHESDSDESLSDESSEEDGDDDGSSDTDSDDVHSSSHMYARGHTSTCVPASKKVDRKPWYAKEKDVVKETLQKYIRRRRPLPGKDAIVHAQ